MDNNAANPFFEAAPSAAPKASHRILNLLQAIVVIVLLGIVTYMFILTPNQVDGPSMFPTLQDKQLLLTNRFHQVSGTAYTYGDIIIFNHPSEKREVVKRIIGLAGDSIKIEGGKVFVNDSQINEAYLSPTITTKAFENPPEGQSVVVPADSYYVLGDNRDFSGDSRLLEFMFVKRSQIIGKVALVLTPMIKSAPHGGISNLK